MRTLGVAALAASFWIAAGAPQDASKKTAPKKAASRKAAPSASATRKTAAKSASKKASSKSASSKKTSGSKKSAAAKRKPGWRAGQMSPTPERYREIQEALSRTGYLEGPATGVWDARSTESLKRFQEAQNLKPDGKLDSLSLIALGLGPKREAQARLSPPPKPLDP